MSEIRIIIAEHDEDAYDGLCDSYKSIFEAVGYTPTFTLYRNLQEESDYLDFDILIMDISWGQVEGYDGLEKIRDIKEQFPNLYIIANSQERIDHYTSSKYLPTFDIFIQKDFLIQRNYQEHIVGKIKSSFKKNIYLTIDNNSDCGKYDKQLLTDILKDITFIDHEMDSKFTVSKIKLSSLYGGWSDSQVFKMEMYSSLNLKLTNAILKVSTNKELISREVKNYLKFVKLYIPYMGRPEMIGYSYTKNLGAICYSFAYDDDKEFKSLSEYLINRDINKLDKAIEIIFKPSRSRWYNENNWKTSEQGLTSYYTDKWIPNLSRHEEKNVFEKIIKQHRGSFSGTDIKINNEIYKRPTTILFGRPLSKYIETISHGDLNTNNILLSSDDHLTYIDFSETKYGHVFEDFVTFEGAIRTTINLELDFLELLKLEELFSHKNLPNDSQVSQYDENIIMLYKAIHRLRDYAFIAMHKESKKNYYYALAFYLYRLLRIDDYEEFKYDQITASLLVAIKKLMNKT